MKKYYTFFFRSCLLSGFLTFSGLGAFSQNYPQPDVFYTFDQTTGTEVIDSSENGYNGLWYNYFGKTSAENTRAGWRPDKGVRGGAFYLSGDHAFGPDNCPAADQNCSCSSGSDLLIFAPSVDPGGSCDDEIVDTSMVKTWLTDHKNATVSFWFKNDWSYYCSDVCKHYSALDTCSCAWERQVLFTMGDGQSGITVEAFEGSLFTMIKASINNNGTDENLKFLQDSIDAFEFKRWVHLTFVFDGNQAADTGKFYMYVNGKLRKSVKTSFGILAAQDGSVVFGGEQGQSVSKFNVSDCWGSAVDYCGVLESDIGHLRYGWPARGYIDDFVFWKDTALTTTQIKQFVEDHTSSGGNVNVAKLFSHHSFTVFPSPTTGNITIKDLPEGVAGTAVIYSTIGQRVLSVPTVTNNSIIELPMNLQNGIYFIQISDAKRIIGIQRFAVQK